MKQFLFFLVLFPALLLAQGTKKYPTLLWKISGNNLKKPSYLYGTMHVSNRVAYYLSEQFFDALKSVDVVGLETNPGEWLENMERTGELSELNQFRGSSYSQDFYRTIFSARFPDKKILQGILSYDPDIIDGLLYRQSRARENFEESTYIDLFIYQSAAKLNKQLISLEDFSASEIRARLSALPDEAPDEGERNYSNYYASAQKIEDAYREGNLDLLDSLSKLTSSHNTQRFLINDRNVFFVNTIDSVLKTKSIFSGVGAAHLPGEDGVIELLRKKGYTVEPVTPKVSKKSHATREDLDVQVKPVGFQKQVISDSLFSVNVPGKLYPILNIENLKYYIYADMVNGSFYTVVRLKHLGPQFGVTPAQLMARVDSLLFESIPGKILEKKEISVNGVRGLEIVNRTRRGDVQHYQVFFTDMELLLFKLGGKHQYATGSEAKQFFSSISFNQRGENMVNFSPKTKGFSVRVPANYSYAKNDGSTAIGLAEDLYAYSGSKKQSYGVKHAVYNDFYYLEEDSFELNRLVKNILLNYNFTLTPKYTLTKEQGLPAITFGGTSPNNQVMLGKVIIKGVHYYFVYTVSESGTPVNNEFFDSFKLGDFESVNPLKEVNDKDFCFKAIDEVTDNALSRFNENYAKAYKEAFKDKKDSARSDYEFRSSNKYYYSPSSNEYVNITFEKYNDYDYRDKKEIDTKIADSYKNTTSMVVANRTSSVSSNGMYTFRCALKDTATVRAIDVRVFIRNGIMLEVSAPYDTTIGLRGWTKSFIESFSVKDTVVGKDIFENKFAILLNDLGSSDTVKRQAANISLRTAVGMQKAFGDDYVKFISGPRIHLVNEDSRAQLFVSGGTIENRKIIQPYKDLYKHYTDSFYLQLCLLKGLACLKTVDSYSAFYGLVMGETPLVGSEATVNDVFAALHDSLELCRNFFPGMLSLTKYDEYRDAVYALMADLVNLKLLKPEAYAARREDILVDASLALKRYTPGTKSSGEEYNSFESLDKPQKELAENLKTSLDALANNNLYKDTRYLRSVDFYSRPTMVNYAFVLAPFYKTDEKTRQLIGKIGKLKAQSVAMHVAINLMKYNVALNDTLASYYSRNKFTRVFFYSELEKEKLTEKFDKKYLSQLNMVESLVGSQKQLNNFYNYEKEKSRKDTMTLFKTLPATNRYQEGTIYVYKAPKGKNDDEQWSAVFVPSGKDAITSKIEIVSSGYYIDNTKTEQENINDLLDYFYLNYRKRASSGSSNSQ